MWLLAGTILGTVTQMGAAVRPAPTQRFNAALDQALRGCALPPQRCRRQGQAPVTTGTAGTAGAEAAAGRQ